VPQRGEGADGPEHPGDHHKNVPSGSTLTCQASRLGTPFFAPPLLFLQKSRPRRRLDNPSPPFWHLPHASARQTAVPSTQERCPRLTRRATEQFVNDYRLLSGYRMLKSAAVALCAAGANEPSAPTPRKGRGATVQKARISTRSCSCSIRHANRRYLPCHSTAI
jgi:hypothetical protein